MKDKFDKEFNLMLLTASKDKMLFQKVVKSIFTVKELEEFALRWQIIKRISKGETHRQISKDLGVGVATVTRGSRELSNKKGGFSRILKQLKSK